MPVGGLGVGEMVLIFLVVLLLLGARRLPGIGSSLARGLGEFRGSVREIEAEMRGGPVAGPVRRNPVPAPARPWIDVALGWVFAPSSPHVPLGLTAASVTLAFAMRSGLLQPFAWDLLLVALSYLTAICLGVLAYDGVIRLVPATRFGRRLAHLAGWLVGCAFAPLVWLLSGSDLTLSLPLWAVLGISVRLALLLSLATAELPGPDDELDP